MLSNVDTSQDGLLSTRRRERALVVLLSMLAAIKVLVFSAAFPLFSNVDEPKHFDCVWRCARGRPIAGLQKFGPGTVAQVAYFQSCEYIFDPELTIVPFEKPGWLLSGDKLKQRLAEQLPGGVQITNIEGVQPPVYYLVYGAWYRLGMLFGASPFWIRFLNAAVCGLLVWLAYAFARALYPNRQFLHLGLPMIVAFLPQDLFYSINNGVLSPLVYGAAFCCLMLIATGRRATLGFHALAGLLCGIAVLTQYTNATILFAMLITMASTRRNLRGMALLLAAAGLPVAIWTTRNCVEIGAPTAIGQFLAYTKWQVKPLPQIFDHPVFGPRGAAHFWAQLTTTFFRGEFLWHGQPVRFPLADAFYVLSPALLMLCAAPLALRRAKEHLEEQLADRAAWVVILVSVAALLIMSIRYEFGDWAYPSHANPYYSYGRLIYGTLLPFLTLYLGGLDALLSRLGFQRLFFPALVAIGVFMFASDVLVSLPVFGSQFNWFHMISSGRHPAP